MKKDEKVYPGKVEGERSSTDPVPEVKRWSANRKKETVLRLMRGEPIDALSRELGIEIYRLEEWHKKALQGIETALKAREGDPLTAELDAAMRRIGEITMENELLREKARRAHPLGSGDRRNERYDLPCNQQALRCATLLRVPGALLAS
jgi:transposase